MAAGYLAQQKKIVDDIGIQKMNKVVFNVFIPLMVAYNLYSSDASSAFNPQMIVYVVCAVLAQFLLAFLYGVFFVKKPEQRGVIIQGLYRSNVTLMGLQLLANLVTDADLGPLCALSAFTAPLFNTMAVVCLEVYSGKKPDIKKLLINVVKNPIMAGCAAGVLLLVLDIQLPTAIDSGFRDMAKAASPVAVFLLGAFFKFSGAKQHLPQLIATALGRLIISPAIFLSLAALLGFRGIYFDSMIAVFATSTSVPSFTMVQQIGGDAELAGDIVVVTNFLCPLTIALWCFIFKSLGIF